MPKEKSVHLATDYSLPVTQYASQGNAILGIRDSGKSYSAMKLAEELLSNGIPIIAFDPIGIWRHLKTGTGGHKGFEVVVAGGYHPDIPLTTETAPDIIRAAMKENISLIIDVYSPELSNKSKWIRIVQDMVEILMYENSSYGLRHIFLEEAAEFIPQRLEPQHNKVYSAIESLARMGRNVGLGYTLINQRAEQVNKAILEIAEFSLLHKQVGKNTLLSIKKWMEVLQVENTNELLQSLPNLQKGQCWAIGQNQQPQKIQVAKKKTFHPDPQKPDVLPANTKTINVSAFVQKMQKQLKTPAEELPAKISKVDTSLIDKLRKEKDEAIGERDRALIQLQKIGKELLPQFKQHRQEFEGYIASARKSFDAGNAIADAISEEAMRLKVKLGINAAATSIQQKTVVPTKTDALSVGSRPPTPGSGAIKLLQAAAMFHPKAISKQRMATIAGCSHKSSTYRAYMASLKRSGLIETAGSDFVATAKGLIEAGDYESLPTNPSALCDMWITKLGPQNGASRILKILFDHHPKSMTKDDLSEASGTSHKSSTFRAYMALLRRNGLVSGSGEQIKAADELFN